MSLSLFYFMEDRFILGLSLGIVICFLINFLFFEQTPFNEKELLISCSQNKFYILKNHIILCNVHSWRNEETK